MVGEQVPASGDQATGNQPSAREPLLLDEPSTADLREKVTQAWRDFAASVAATLPTLPAGAQVVLTLDPTASGTGDAIYSVSLRIGLQDRLSASAVSNAALPAAYRMDRTAVADLVALGWSPPGVVQGSGDNFGLATTVTEANQLASIITRTLRDVYGAPHPAFLVYSVRDDNDASVDVEPFGTARPESSLDGDFNLPADDPLSDGADGAADDDDMLPLDEQVRTVVATMMRSTPEHLHVDADGDIGIRAGSAMVFVRIRENPPLVDVFSPVLTEIEPTEQLYVKLSELTNRMPIGRLYCTNDTVWASVPVFGRNFQPTHLMLAVQVMTGLADELDDRLHGEFGGKRFFGDGDKPSRETGSHRTGMYL
ncbi:T3SS (YopN, CesT) and YbjN peptide-binding chaperone 1 [Solwaraspora sp. WMMB335]|uniref:T3SS (YopN, CesT) and YbjN peptide-binding chaperone 1 n=1 Tax=Solwaraspora sp. WMMB335 TaxID=3404118 RepID=UPI003B95C57F